MWYDGERGGTGAEVVNLGRGTAAMNESVRVRESFLMITILCVSDFITFRKTSE